MIIDTNLRKMIQQALKEDIGAKDITTTSVLLKSKKGKFILTAMEDCVGCGLDIAEAVFEIVDAVVRFKPVVNDGMQVLDGKAIAYVEGPCWSILPAERTALNFLSWLSGISTLTSKYVEAVKDTRAKIFDTRKTTPGYRKLEKHAVRMGGGSNHRMGLYDQILVKDNHLLSLTLEPAMIKNQKDALISAIKSAKTNAPKGKRIEVEIDSLDMLKIALEHNPDIIMLDNMGVDKIREAVKIRDAYRVKVGDVGFKVMLEVSGNVGLNSVREIAECGVDMISVGALTHSAPAVDISLDVQ